MTLLETMLSSANNWQSIVCDGCTHPYSHYAGGCSDIRGWDCEKCLNEIHFAESAYNHQDPNKILIRKDYDCSKLLHCYVQRFADRYYKSIKYACKNIDFGIYPILNILSLGCGNAPDLAALHELAAGKPLIYTGVDSNPCWSALQRNIENYAQNLDNNLFVKFICGDALQPSNLPQTEIYNVVVIQWLISTILKGGGTPENIYSLFNGIVASAASRWREEHILDSPFLIILSDVDNFEFGNYILNSPHTLIT